MVGDEPLATLIGDLVSSRQHEDRRGLQRMLTAALNEVNRHLSPVQHLELTVGDEFQGGFSSVASAARASLLVRLELLARSGGGDSRYGLGYGAVNVFDADRAPTSQDGPGWWSARQAIDRARVLAKSPRTSFARTCFASWSEEPADRCVDAASIEAFLLCRDATVAGMNARQRRLLLGLLVGRTQEQLASDEGITQSAVSQNLRRSGAFAIEVAHRRLDGIAA
jgi:SatD family protein